MSSHKRASLSGVLKTPVIPHTFMMIDKNTFLFMSEFVNNVEYLIEESNTTRSNFIEVFNVMNEEDEVVGNLIRTISMIQIEIGSSPHVFLRRYYNRNDVHVSDWNTELLTVIEGESGLLILPISIPSGNNRFEERLAEI